MTYDMAQIRELTDYVDFGGPEWEGYDSTKQQINKVAHQAKRYIKNNSPDLVEKIEIEGADTLYKVLKKHPPINLILMLAGSVSPEDIYKLTVEGINPHLETYEYVMDQGKALVEEWLKVVDTIRATARGTKPVEDKEVEDIMSEIKFPPEKTIKTVDLILEDDGLPPLREIIETANKTLSVESTIEEYRKECDSVKEKAAKELEEMRLKISEAMSRGSFSGPVEITSAITEVPSGTMVRKKASELFPEVALAVDFELPYMEWEFEHPDVPKADPHYIFRPEYLNRLFFSINNKKIPYLHGDTGTGKTTLVEQVASRLNFPFYRVSFDSDITRSDLTGKDEIKVEDGKTVSKYLEGLLPKILSQPCMSVFDEVDFVMPDVGYVMQSTLEGKGMTLLEDGGRRVPQHPLCFLFATGNTVGQGDEEGKYQGARAQSMAFLDRFGVWIKVDYLDAEERSDLLKRHCPVLTEEQVDKISRYVTEHIEAFKKNNLFQPLSPRGIIAIGEATQVFNNVEESIRMVVIDRASQTDRATLNGIVDRVLG